MAEKKRENIQVKLALDEGLEKTWKTLTDEYSALDKPGIIRLALNNLAKQVNRENVDQEMLQLVRDLEANYEGMSESEFAEYWNKNKKKLRAS